MDIGKYVSSLDAPAASGIPRATPEEYGGASAAGMGVLAKEALEYDQAFTAQADDVQRAQDVSRMSVDVHKAVADLDNALEERPDWKTHEANWTKGFSKIREQALSGINDPIVKRGALQQLGSIEASGYVRAKARKRQLFVDSSKAGLENTLQDAMEGAAQVKDPAALIALGVGAIRSSVVGGVISAEEGAKTENDFIEGVQVGFAKRDILADPMVYFAKRKTGEYSQVGIGKIDLLDQQAIRQIEHNNRMAEQQVKKAQEKRSAEVLAGVEAGAVDDAALDDAFLGPTRDPNFTPEITPDAYKEGKVKLAARRREGGFRNPGMTNSYKIELSLNPHRYSDQAIVGLSAKGLHPGDVLDLLEYKRGRIDDLQKMPPGASSGMDMIRTAVPRGFMNTMTDKTRAQLIADEQEYIRRVKKDPGRWFEIASDISNRWKTVKNPMGTGAEDLKKALEEAGK